MLNEAHDDVRRHSILTSWTPSRCSRTTGQGLCRLPKAHHRRSSHSNLKRIPVRELVAACFFFFSPSLLNHKI
jgi:hypothetical protein